ncbi:Ig-like domain-containing protein [Pontiellaceae bacterium B12227]|nr:Ig-like domain-containing protein [Pontiellaceae bacterium B12227]
MRNRWLGIIATLASVLLAGTAQAAVVYEDNFDNDTLGVNTNGIGGGLTSRTLRGGNHYWDDTGVLQFVTTANTHYLNRVIAYTEDGFQSSDGFELTVNYYNSLNTGQSKIAFGLISDDTDFSTYSGYNPFTTASTYGFGATTKDGILSTTDGVSSSNLHVRTALPLSTDTEVIIRFENDGFGGADWSWTVGGVAQTNGNLAVFDFSKTYHFVAYGQDDQGNKRINSVSLEALGNAVPTADSQSVKVYPDTAWDITLTGSDPEGSNLTYNVTSLPTNGALDVTSIPDVIYTPNAGFEGDDSFSFTVYDGELTSATATVSIVVAPNDAPVAVAQDVQTQPDTAKDITLTGTDTDGPSNLTYAVDDTLLIGSLTGTAPDLTYTPAGGYIGIDSFTFTVNDGISNSEPATVSIAVTNELPIANAQSLDVFPESLLDITLTGSDPDNGPSNLSFTVLSLPMYGLLDGGSNIWTYTPTPGYEGADSFTFKVWDGLAFSDPATISIAVTNYVPTANSQQVITDAGTNVLITLTGTDPEGSNLTYTAGSPANGSLSGTAPNLTYTPDEGFEGADSFTFTVNDGVRDSDPATVSIWVESEGVNISFLDLNTALSNNTLNVGGSTSNLTVEGVANGNDYVYTVTYAGADIDGDSVNDTLTFDVLVEAFNGSVASTEFKGTDTDKNAYNGSAVIGTNDVAVTLNANGWSVADGVMQAGETLALTVQNLSVSASAGSAAASLNRFTGVTYRETNSSYGHQVVIGEGAGNLFATRFNQTQYAINNVLIEGNPLYVTSADTGSIPSSNAQRWNLFLADLSINVKAGGVPDIAMGVSGGNLVFSWEGTATYDVLTNANLQNASGWGVAIPSAASPVTNAVGSEAQLFFKLSE